MVSFGEKNKQVSVLSISISNYRTSNTLMTFLESELEMWYSDTVPSEFIITGDDKSVKLILLTSLYVTSNPCEFDHTIPKVTIKTLASCHILTAESVAVRYYSP